MADSRLQAQPPHDCPGGCGESVPHNKLACRDCWWLLPVELRKSVTNARGGNRLRAVGEAAKWLRENVAEDKQIGQEPSRWTMADRFGGRPR